MIVYGTHTFQIAWIDSTDRVTWEPASALPLTLIDEFERNDVCTQETITDSSFGVINHTAVVKKSDPTMAPSAKLLKTTVFTSEAG